MCRCPEPFAQQALGHNSKAVHHAYSKHAEVIVPSLDDWENEWQKNPHRIAQPKLLPVDFRSPLAAIAQTNYNKTCCRGEMRDFNSTLCVPGDGLAALAENE